MPARPEDTEHAPYYVRYINLVPEVDVLPVLRAQIAQIGKLATNVSPAQEGFRYAESKWSIREVCGHLIDVERIFGYRAFCIGRGEQAALPSFDENAYVAASHYDTRDLSDLISEFIVTRQANLAFLEHLPERAWMYRGTAGDNPVTVNALVFIMAGHVRHHLAILETRYGVEVGGLKNRSDRRPGPGGDAIGEY